MERSATVKDFLTIVFKYKYRIILLFSFIVATVTIFTYVYPFTYEASAKILVKFDRNELSVSGSANSSNSSIIMRDSQREVLSEIEILNNRFLMEKVVKELWDELTAISIETPTTLWQKTKFFFKTSYRRIKNKVLEIAYKLDLVQRADPFQAVLRGVQSNFKISAVQKSNVINVRYRSWNPVLAAKVVNTLTDLYLEHHIEVRKVPRAYGFFAEQKDLLEKKLIEQEEKLKKFKERWNLSSIKDERSLMLANLSELMLEDKNYNRDFHTKEMTKYESRIRTLDEKEMDLHRMKLNLKIIEDSYERYLSRLEDIRISEALDLAAISNVTVIEPALVPISPVRKIKFIPRRILHLLIGTIMGLIVGLGYAFLADYFDHTFKSSHEIEKILNTTCLASIPREK